MRFPLLLATAALLLSACGEETGDDPDVESGPDLDGRTFIATAITDAGRTRHLAAGTELRLTFKDGELGINAGCNHMSGAYELDGDQLSVGMMSMTEMGCPPKLMAQDTWVAGLFEEPVTLELDEDVLRLSAAEVDLVLTDRVVASPDAELEGTTWQLDALIEGDAVSSIPGDVVATLIIVGGEARIDDGCNAIGADVAVSGPMLTFTDIEATTIDCKGAAAEVAQQVRDVLFEGSPTWTITEQSLSILSDELGLGFRVA